MPKYIYLHPDTNEEHDIVHSMNEVTNPSTDLLERITLPDGRIMKRKIVAPALIGFDNLGRSTISKKEKEPSGVCEKAGSEKCDCSCASPPDTKTASAA
jgi:hypothetical protein